MDDTPLITGSHNQPTSKEGSQILGCCCDSKRSTIIWNLLNIIHAAILMAVWIVVVKVPGVEDKTTSPEAAQQLNKTFGIIVAFSSIAIALNLLTIYGVMKYDAHLVRFGLVWNIIYLIYLIVLAVLVTIHYKRTGNQNEFCVWLFLFIDIAIFLIIMMIYSGYVFAKEVTNDIMSKETYEREKVVLCC